MAVPRFLMASENTLLETEEVMLNQMTPADRAVAQMDQDLNQIIHLYRARQMDMAKLCNFNSQEVKALLPHQLKLKLQEEVLYLKTFPNQEDQNDMRLVLPWAYHVLAMNGCHDDLGHVGTECMLDLLCDCFYWPMMQDDTDWHIQWCGRCNRFKVCPHCKPVFLIS